MVRLKKERGLLRLRRIEKKEKGKNAKTAKLDFLFQSPFSPLREFLEMGKLGCVFGCITAIV
jgi:hypothetical protein